MAETDTLIPESPCTKCGHMMSGAYSEEGHVPTPGDVTICIQCSHIMVFTDALEHRDPTNDELVEIGGDPALIRYLDALAKARATASDERTPDEKEGKDNVTR